jgi:N-acetylneuraminate synthase
MKERYRLVTGLSDHKISNVTAIASVAMGSSIIEKHFTLNRLGGGPDDSFSLEVEGLHQLCADTKVAWDSIGRIDYQRKNGEFENLKFRRSLYFVKNLMSGDLITPDAVRSIRPGFGLAPKYLDKVLGKKVKISVSIGDRVTSEIIDNF